MSYNHRCTSTYWVVWLYLYCAEWSVYLVLLCLMYCIATTKNCDLATHPPPHNHLHPLATSTHSIPPTHLPPAGSVPASCSENPAGDVVSPHLCDGGMHAGGAVEARNTICEGNYTCRTETTISSSRLSQKCKNYIPPRCALDLHCKMYCVNPGYQSHHLSFTLPIHYSRYLPFAFNIHRPPLTLNTHRPTFTLTTHPSPLMEVRGSKCMPRVPAFSILSNMF